jgi:hypothetical protein
VTAAATAAVAAGIHYYGGWGDDLAAPAETQTALLALEDHTPVIRVAALAAAEAVAVRENLGAVVAAAVVAVAASLVPAADAVAVEVLLATADEQQQQQQQDLLLL